MAGRRNRGSRFHFAYPGLNVIPEVLGTAPPPSLMSLKPPETDWFFCCSAKAPPLNFVVGPRFWSDIGAKRKAPRPTKVTFQMENQTWATKEVKIRAKRNSGKRHSELPRKSEKTKRKRRTNRHPALSGFAVSAKGTLPNQASVNRVFRPGAK